MDFSIRADQRKVVDEVVAFRNEVLAPMEQDFLLAGNLPPEERTALEYEAKGRGLWSLDVDIALGGRGLDELTMCLISEELYQHPAMFNFGGSPEPCLYLGTDEQKLKYLFPVIAGSKRSAYAFTEPSGGSDFAGIVTRASRIAGGWRIDGEKSLIAYLDRADFVIVFATIDPALGAQGVTCFLVDRDTSGMEMVPSHDNMGDGWPTWTIKFDDCRVGDHAVLGEPGGAWDIANELLGHGRLRIAAYQLGIAQRSLDIAVDYARERHTWGQPLASRQSIQWMLGDSSIELDAARLLVHRAAWMVDQGQRSRSADLAAKLYATEMAQRVTDRALQILGGVGYQRDSPVQSFYRQVRAWRIGHGSSEISRMIVARDLLGDEAGRPKTGYENRQPVGR
jgi:acyl-CoA dehydrogenase